MKDIAVYGAGGFGREVACLIEKIDEKEKKWNIIGFFDDGIEYGSHISKHGSVLGGITELNEYPKDLAVVFAIGNPLDIEKLVNRITSPRISFPNIIPPDITYIDESSLSIGHGNIINYHCQISCGVTIGNFNIINGYVPVGHDVSIGNYNVIMPSVNISGGVKIGDTNFIGVQAVVLQNIKIGNHVRIGANSVVIRNTKDGFLYMGNPAMKIKL